MYTTQGKEFVFKCVITVSNLKLINTLLPISHYKKYTQCFYQYYILSMQYLFQETLASIVYLCVQLGILFTSCMYMS